MVRGCLSYGHSPSGSTPSNRLRVVVGRITALSILAYGHCACGWKLCVSVELGRGAKHEYGDLITAFGIFEDRCHALESLWFLSTPGPPFRSTTTFGGSWTLKTP
jgi:hypothetical protein